MRLSGASEEDLNVLVDKGYVKILNEELVSYICDWKRNNYIQSDRYHPSFYQKLLEKVLGNELGKQTHTGCIQDGYKAYTPVDTSRIQDVYKMDTEVRLGKDRIGQISLGEERVGAEGSADPATPSPTPATPPPLSPKICFGTRYRGRYRGGYRGGYRGSQQSRDKQSKV